MLLPDLTPRDSSARDHRPRLHPQAFTRGPLKIAILSDYVRLPYANGATFATQFLYRELRKRGHDVTIIGPRDPAATDDDMPEKHICLPSLPFKNHPGVYLPVPLENIFAQAATWDFDMVLAQTNTELIELGLWLRHTRGIPLLCVNTVHLPSVYPVVLPEALNKSPAVHWAFQNTLLAIAEKQSATVYDQSDGLIVLSKGLEKYWRERGVRAPIHVIPRSVEPKIFDAPTGADPFPKNAKAGARLLVVCRHTREKAVERLLRIFARWIVPAVPEATLTLVGDGPDHDLFKQYARELGVADKTFFPGEFAVTDIPTWYHHADIFTYASLSETYGQVVSEALWSHLPVVAFADGMGVSHQVEHDVTGMLVEPGPDEEVADWQFARATVSLLRNPRRRNQLAANAERHARDRSAPERTIDRYLTAFEAAQKHCKATITEPAGTDNVVLNTTRSARWMALSALVAGLGLLKAPAKLNRHGRKQPTWKENHEEATEDASDRDARQARAG